MAAEEAAEREAALAREEANLIVAKEEVARRAQLSALAREEAAREAMRRAEAEARAREDAAREERERKLAASVAELKLVEEQRASQERALHRASELKKLQEELWREERKLAEAEEATARELAHARQLIFDREQARKAVEDDAKKEVERLEAQSRRAGKRLRARRAQAALERRSWSGGRCAGPLWISAAEAARRDPAAVGVSRQAGTSRRLCPKVRT